MKRTGWEAERYSYHIAVRLFETRSWSHAHGQKTAVHCLSSS
jgi:hypothetical protein